jgi:hypothetical protein
MKIICICALNLKENLEQMLAAAALCIVNHQLQKNPFLTACYPDQIIVETYI